MDYRKEAKESRAKKLHQLTVKAPDAKVDASGFTPYADPEMDKKTGKRPINPRAFKRGGKVTALEGGKAKKRGDRMGAKGRMAKQAGGNISAEDKAKMAEMAAAAAKEKSALPRASNVPLPPRRPEPAPQLRAKEDIQSPYKKGGRTKKMMGGDITAGGNPQIPSSRGNTSLLRKAVGLDYKKGGRIKKDDGGSTPAPAPMYHVFDNKTGDVVGKFKNRNAARAMVDRKDNEYGGYNYHVKTITPGQEMEPKSSGGRTKKMNGGPMMAGPTQTLMKRKTPMNNPAAKAPAVVPMRAKGGKVSHMEWEHSKKDLAQDKKLAKKHGMSLEKWEKSAADKKHDKQQSTKGLMCGGRTKKADGGAKMRSEYTEQAKASRKDRDKFYDTLSAKDNIKKANDKFLKSATDQDMADIRVSEALFDRANRRSEAESKRNLNTSSQTGYSPSIGYPATTSETFGKASERLKQSPVGFGDDEEMRRGGRTKRTKRASGGRAKGKSNINIVIAPQPAAGGMPPMGMPPRPMMPPPPMPAPGGMPPGGMPPGAMGGAGGIMPVPIAIGGGGAPAPAMAPQGAGVPGLAGMAPLPRKSGGRIKSYKDMTAGAGSGEGRLQKEEMAEYKRVGRKAGGSVPNMTAGAGSGPGRIEKIHAYGENPHGEAAPKPKKRSWTM